MFKSFKYGIEVLRISWRANGIFAVLSIFSNIYSSTLFPFFQVFLLAKILDLLQENQFLQFSDIFLYAQLYIVAVIINVSLSCCSNEGYLEENFGAYIDRIVINKLTTLDPATFEKADFQELLTQTDSAKGTMIAQIQKMTKFIDAIAKVITATIVLLPIFPLFIPLILFSVFPSFYVGNVFRKKLWPFFTTKRSVLTRMSDYIKNLLSQDGTSKEARIFQTGQALQEKVSSQQISFFNDFRKINIPFLRQLFFSSIFQQFVFLCSQYYNLLAVLRGSLGIGQFALAFQQTLNLATGSQAILDNYSSMMMRIQTLENFFNFMDYKPHIISPTESKPYPTSPTPPIIEFRNVAFRYPKTKRDILKDFNMTIHNGEKIALVGENGAGKTTIIKLLLRFYDVTEGELLINGVNIKELSLDEWHKQVGALFQDFIKYQFTFKENIYFGNLDEKNNETLLREAIIKSGADKYVGTLPKDIHQIVGKMFDTGIDLSGGQWQKLALARAFFRNAPILILDEPTSAIDAKAEYEIFENVQKLQKDKTVIIISHRFSTVRHADTILVLNEGKILESGNHGELMKKKGLYADLFEIQAQGYK